MDMFPITEKALSFIYTSNGSNYWYY